ncbi:MAG: YggS family pyridoxal phosphate-dependent enzyme [Clostridiales bacterium]|nr:YggS family pyridoxal phosphate-dependent enzyme [Clostridiales bacterium]
MIDYIGSNIEKLREEIAAACSRCGRKPDDITLVAVSKTVGTEEIQQATNYGCRVFGENRVQAFLEKYEYFGEEVDFHLIGHLQTNKVKNIIGKVKLIHSVDSIRLLDEIEHRAKAANVVQDILIQVDVSGEESKFGASEDELLRLIKHNEGNSNVKIKGLMTMAPFVENSEEIRWVFRKLRDIFIDIAGKTFYNTDMEYTSMGMSGDFAVAIEEGADIIRVGSKIFHNVY